MARRQHAIHSINNDRGNSIISNGAANANRQPPTLAQLNNNVNDINNFSHNNYVLQQLFYYIFFANHSTHHAVGVCARHRSIRCSVNRKKEKHVRFALL